MKLAIEILEEKLEEKKSFLDRDEKQALNLPLFTPGENSSEVLKKAYEYKIALAQVKRARDIQIKYEGFINTLEDIAEAFNLR